MNMPRSIVLILVLMVMLVVRRLASLLKGVP